MERYLELRQYLPDARWAAIPRGRCALSWSRQKDSIELVAARDGPPADKDRGTMLLLGVGACRFRTAGAFVMARTKGARPVTWANQVFDGSKVGRRGGPVRRSLASIMKNSAPRIVINEAKRRGWSISAFGDHWIFCDATLSHRYVLRSATSPMSRKRRRRRGKGARAASPSLPVRTAVVSCRGV